MYDLDFVPTADLLNELTKRFDHLVFMGARIRKNYEMAKRWQGNQHTCAGLTDDLKASILAELHSRTSAEYVDHREAYREEHREEHREENSED